MKKRYDYKTCPICGASLDVGEKCDCLAEKTPSRTPYTGFSAPPSIKPQTTPNAAQKGA